MWKAAVNQDPGSFDVVIRLAQLQGDQQEACTPSGTLDPFKQSLFSGEEVPGLLRLPTEAVEALRDALNGYVPPTSDADVREALHVERARVDRVIEWLLNGSESGDVTPL